MQEKLGERSLLIKRSEWVEQSWRNGLGSSYVIWTGDAGQPSGLQIFRTSITQPAAFSDYSGHDRIFVLLDDAALDLTVNGRKRRVLPREVVRFHGEAAVRADVPDGPVEVLNLILDRTQWREVHHGETAHLAVAHMAGFVPGHVLSEGDTTISISAPASHPEMIELHLVRIS